MRAMRISRCACAIPWRGRFASDSSADTLHRMPAQIVVVKRPRGGLFALVRSVPAWLRAAFRGEALVPSPRSGARGRCRTARRGPDAGDRIRHPHPRDPLRRPSAARPGREALRAGLRERGGTLDRSRDGMDRIEVAAAEATALLRWLREDAEPRIRSAPRPHGRRSARPRRARSRSCTSSRRARAETACAYTRRSRRTRPRSRRRRCSGPRPIGSSARPTTCSACASGAIRACSGSCCPPTSKGHRSARTSSIRRSGRGGVRRREPEGGTV